MNININKNMKRFFIIAVMFLSCVIANAQNVKHMPSDVYGYSTDNMYPSYSRDYMYPGGLKTWVAEWKKVVKENLQDQKAWRNLFWATFLYEKNSLTELNTDEIKMPMTALVMRKMKDAVPDSYVFNLCACHFWIEKEWGKWKKDVLHNAVESIPSDAYDEDILRLAKLLWEKDCNNNKLLAKVYYRIYERHLYPYREMRYGWNLVKSMPQDAIFVAHDAMELEPVKIIQEVLDERQDITVIPCKFIFSSEFRDSICKRLNIKPFVLKKKKGITDEDYVAKFTMHLIKETKRPLYQPFDMINYSNLCLDSLYNEGLLVKYSDKRYDNISVLLNNVKNVYDLKYLAEPPLVKDLNYDSTNEHKILISLTYVVKLLRKRRLYNEEKYLHGIIFEFCVKNADGPLGRKVSDILSNRNYENTPDL